MKCPYCGADDTKVIDSRPAEENNAIRRRRQCEKCNKRFTTYEKVETIPLIVIKKENIREPYDRGKIEAGILRSCHKRPVSYDQCRLWKMLKILFLTWKRKKFQVRLLARL